MGDIRFDTGMTVREAITRARLWWDGRGRKLAWSIDTDKLARECSGILAGAEWDSLQEREKVAVVKAWHHVFVRRPDLLDIAPNAPFKLGGEETVQ